jgi:hypothetical protein
MTKRYKLAWMHSSLLAAVEVIEFHATEAYSNLRLTNVQYSIKRLCREEKVTDLINNNNNNNNNNGRNEKDHV